MDEMNQDPNFGHIDEFADDDCPMCGETVGANNMIEIEPGLDPVCPRCAGEYEENKLVDDAEARRDHALDMKMDARRMGEGAGFDRFMDRILVEERRVTKDDKVEDNPQRRRQAARQERPLGRVRIGGK